MGEESFSSYKYSCKRCNFNTNNKSNYERHILTAKHINYLKSNKCIETKFNCMHCKRMFKSRSGLWKHQNICSKKSSEKSENSEVIMKVLEENSDLRKLLCKQQEQINVLIPKVGNNNNNHNQFNLNIFLNTQCKDAINWEEFINSLEVSMENLNNVMNEGITNGIAQVICQGIDELGIYKRPIHCLDTKRKKICIKREGIWEHSQEKTNEDIINSQNKLQHKHVLLIQKWQEDHPNWACNENETNTYITMIQKLMQNVDDNKYINEISKSATIPKNNIGNMIDN